MVSMTRPWPEQSVYYIKEGIYMNMILVSLKQKKNVKIVSDWHFCQAHSMTAIQKFYMDVLSEITTRLLTKECPSLRTTFFNRYIQSK